jgi:hypothetical protein
MVMTTKRYLDHAPKKVALLGMGPSIQDYLMETLTQEYKPDFADEVWAINMAAQTFWHDVVFWMDDLYGQETFRSGLTSCLRRRGKPVITSKAYPDWLPNSYDYPLDEVAAIAIPVFGKPYMTNAVAQAIGYALWKGVEVLSIYGADFSYPNRDFAESGRACVEAWIAMICTNTKMQIRLSPNTSLYDSVGDKGVYGYAEQPAITLPDGSVYKYVQKGAAAPAYKPEDSSGQDQQETESHEHISGSLPGENGGSPDPGGPAENHGNGADPTPPASPPRPGESLPDRHPG